MRVIQTQSIRKPDTVSATHVSWQPYQLRSSRYGTAYRAIIDPNIAAYGRNLESDRTISGHLRPESKVDHALERTRSELQ
jgi:hypothetical protein